MTVTERDMILALRAQGEGYGAIAKRLGLSRSTVQSVCRRANTEVPAPVPALTPVEPPTVQVLTCRQCGRAFPQIPGHPAKFCSDTCRMTWWHGHRELSKQNIVRMKLCPTCGVNFDAYRSPRQIYCCRACYITARFGKESKT